MIKSAYEKTESIVDRLVKINAEITIPDIENIFISEYFSLASINDIDYKCLLKYGLNNIEECVHNLQEYFAEYEISKKEVGGGPSYIKRNGKCKNISHAIIKYKWYTIYFVFHLCLRHIEVAIYCLER